MEKMDIGEEVVDLSVSGGRRAMAAPTIPTTAQHMPTGAAQFPPQPEQNYLPLPARTLQRGCTGMMWPHRRSIRPRNDHRFNPITTHSTDGGPQTNGIVNGNVASDDEETVFRLPCPPPPKEANERERVVLEAKLRRLQDEVRNEEMKLVVLKKIRQSYLMKENVAVVPPITPQPPLQVPVHSKPQPQRPSVKPPPPQPAPHITNRQPPISARNVPTSYPPPPPLLGNRGLPPGLPVTLHPVNPPQNNISRAGVSNNISIRNMGIGFPSDRKESRNSPVPPTPPQQERNRISEDNQTPAQRQAAAKLALRKQLEKTLLQIPPPKPPPPEMHFIPNPSNTEFIYLVGLEHVVDYITKEKENCKTPPPPEPFQCSQCSTDFTPVWKWEKGSNKGKGKVICEQCVTSNVKKALKAEHTNRLKTAFVKALQQEQEIEQRLAQSSPKAEPPAAPAPPPQPQPPPPPPPQPIIKASTPKPTPPPSSNRDHLAKLADTAKYNPHHVAATLHQQLIRGLPQGLPTHMIPFSPLLYPYQLAMAQAASGKGSAAAAAAANIADFQRQAADIQRQYLLDMIPAPNAASRHSMNNWKS